MARIVKVAVAGLGSIGSKVARALDDGIAGLALSAVAARSADRGEAAVAGFQRMPTVLPLSKLVEAADIVVECLPPTAFDELARSVIAAGNRTLVVASVGRLITDPEILAQLQAASVRVIAPSGALSGLDGLRAAREIGLHEVRLKTRKPPRALGEKIEIDGKSLATSSITEPTRIFAGTARQSVAAFPKNVNVAATVALAGLGPDRTQVELWADPTVNMNTHELQVRSRGGDMTVTCTNFPDEGNPKSSAITAFSIIAALRRLDALLTVGS